MFTRQIRKVVVVGIIMVGICIMSLIGLGSVFAQENFTVAYAPEPSQLTQVSWMEKYINKNYPNFKFERAEIPYAQYVQKMIANLMRPESEYDIMWQNDNWTQLFGQYLEPVGDIPALDKMDKGTKILLIASFSIYVDIFCWLFSNFYF